MKNTAAELIPLWEQYHGEKEELLAGEKNLDFLYALSKARENLLEWYPFSKTGKLLQVGADCGALTGMFAAKVSSVTVLDDSDEELEFVKRRYQAESEKCTDKNAGKASGEIICLKGNLTGNPFGNGENRECFDYITMIGTLAAGEKEAAGQIEAAKSLLSPGGVLFAAVDNPAGLKHWVGAPKEENAIGKKRLLELIEGKEQGTAEIYYPFPDYKLPTEIYSDAYLPEKGDLSGTVISYDYPEFLKADVGASYDMVCEEGQFPEFANSFLIIWRKAGGCA